MKLATLLLQAIAGGAFAAVMSDAQAQVLDIKPGHWKKTIRMEQGGKVTMDRTLDACMTAESLDFQQMRKKFGGNKGVCKLTEEEVTGTRVKVVMQCMGSTTRSTTQVKSREHVIVNATIDNGGQISTSTEDWRFVKSDCPKPASK
ncbi:MAG: DUF3617 family protein [Elioraea sp.]|nr:DUF3617 family protein [Elioraea sp.]